MRKSILVVGALALVLTPHGGDAQTASAIDACVTAGNGRVRIVEDGGSCKRKEHS